MTDRPLTESFDTIGEWHLPEAPEQVIAGSLRYTPDRTELHLNEAFRPLRGMIRVGDDQQTYSAVYGITREGEAMTLLNGQRVGIAFNFGSGGMRQPEKIVSSWLLVGAHMQPDFAYRSVRFRVPGLQIWLSRQVIERSFDRENETSGLTFSYRVRILTEETTRVPSIDANLNWGISSNSNVDAFTSIAVTVSGWLTIQPDTPKPIEWYIEQQSKIVTMLTFLAGAPMSPDCIEAAIDDHHKVSVLIALRDAKSCPYIKLHDFYMPRGEMGRDLADVVRTWFDVYPKVSNPSQLALSVLASEKLWLHVEFLSLMQALEGFHRGLFEGNYMPEDKYESVKKALGDAIPSGLASDHRDALRSRIRYGNQISLRKRLDTLAALLSEPLRLMVFGEEGKVPRQWVDTRNFYTHWDEELRVNVLDGEGIYYANQRMRHFLRALYLYLMGISQEAIAKSLGNASDTSQRLIQVNILERRRRGSNDRTGVIMSVEEQKAEGPNEVEPDQNDAMSLPSTGAGESEPNS